MPPRFGGRFSEPGAPIHLHLRHQRLQRHPGCLHHHTPLGGTVTLSANANQDMGPTPYFLSIVDATTNTQLTRTGSGNTVSFTVSQPDATTHRYIARIDNINGLNTQAVATPVPITWR